MDLMHRCFHSLLTLNHGSLILRVRINFGQFSVKFDLEEVEYFDGIDQSSRIV